MSNSPPQGSRVPHGDEVLEEDGADRPAADVGADPHAIAHQEQLADLEGDRVAVEPLRGGDGGLALADDGHHAHQELAVDAERILAELSRPNPPRIGDKSSPDDLCDAFGISKKAFRRAVGRLLKERSVVIDPGGWLTVARAPERR